MARSKKIRLEFAPLARPRSLSEMAYENIKNSILNGKLVAGQIYSELELARGLGISRTPVREALLKLAAENFIVFHPQKGISVKYFSKEDIENSYDLRQAIEEAALRKTIDKLSREQVQKARSIVAEQEECIRNGYDEKLFLEIDRRFHFFLIEASGNRFMMQTYNQLRDFLIISAKEALMKKGRAQEVIREHKAMVEALAQKDFKKAQEGLTNHLNKSKWSALDHMENK
ncbi:MAG: GntR family transcriptional regulator [Thermodesulfobacteriota bacterium]|nr:GntR family transcriptional regulator [Thermodesulfobacteriota bacterium]